MKDNLPSLAVPGGKIYYEVTGQPHQPSLVLLHAGIAKLRMWDEQIEAFSKHYQVICYDTRAYGKSTTEAVKFSQRQDLLALLEHLKIDKVHLLGISRGGTIAMDFTLEFPDKVASLVMVASNPSGFESDDSEIEKTYFARDEELSESRNAEAMAALDIEMWVDGPGQPVGRASEKVRQKVHALTLEHYQDYFAAFAEKEPTSVPLEPPAIERLTAINVPTLIITGDLDFSYTAVAAELMVREIPTAQHVVIADAAHMVNMEKPEAFNKVVLEFLGHVQKE
jgi:3-oxoadipate enol-lactonase